MVMSVNASDALWYRKGFKNPSAGFPTKARSELMSAMTLANEGEEQEVPLRGKTSPAKTTSKFKPCIATCSNTLARAYDAKLQKAHAHQGIHGRFG